MNASASPPWRVCLVTDVYPPVCGGSGWSTHALARVLLARGHQVSVVLIDPSLVDVVTRTHEGVDVTHVGVRSGRRSLRARLGTRDYAYDILVRFLDTYLSENPSDVVHAQHLQSGPPSVAAGHAHGLATVVTVRDYWPVCLHGTSWWGGRVCEGCTTDALTGCMSEYWGWPRPASRVMVHWARGRLRARAMGLASAHKVLTVSNAVKRRIQAHLPGTELSVVPNIVDPQVVERVADAHATGCPREPFLLAAGKLQPTKGFDMLLSALATTGCATPVLIAGDGPSRSVLEAQAKRTKVSVSFLGWIAHDRLLALQRAANAVLLPSAWNEPLSRVVLETMALGTPVVAWDRGGNPEIIESGISGWLVRDSVDLAEVLELLAIPDQRRRVGEAGRFRVGQRFAPEAVYPQVAAVYAGAIERAAAGRAR